MACSGTQRGASALILEPVPLSVHEWALRNGSLRNANDAATELGLSVGELAHARDNLVELGLLVSSTDGGGGREPLPSRLSRLAIGDSAGRERRARRIRDGLTHQRFRAGRRDRGLAPGPGIGRLLTYL